MPQFNIYPALQARGIDIDIPEIMRKAQGQRTTNALREAQLQELQGAQGRRNREDAKTEAKNRLVTVANLLAVVESAPEEKRELVYQGAVEHARSVGIPVDKAPPTYGDGPLISRLLKKAC